MSINVPPKPVTVQDIINSDERTVNLRKTFENAATGKNQEILTISHVEARIIGRMTVISYLLGLREQFKDDADTVAFIDSEIDRLLAEQREDVKRKLESVNKIRAFEAIMEKAEKDYQVLAQEIIKDLQKKFIHQSGQSGQSGESAPQQSASTHQCEGNCGNCKCHEVESGQQQ